MSTPTAFKRSYLTCNKCEGNTMGRYKDEEGNPLCYGCKPKGKNNKMSICKKCGTGHYQTAAPDMCYICYTKEKTKELRGCPKCNTCGKSIRPKVSEVTICMKCAGGQDRYEKLVRGYTGAYTD